jgi:hypothetical protein
MRMFNAILDRPAPLALIVASLSFFRDVEVRFGDAFGRLVRLVVRSFVHVDIVICVYNAFAEKL